MTPFWTLLAKSEDRLQAALVNVCFMRDHVLPKVMAMDAHGLRSCAELKNRILQAEMKLRLSLERKESRGNHYRTDYPYRDDKNFLCYLVAQQDESGQMAVRRVDYPDDWKGNRSLPYEVRYTSRFPEELEAAAAHGLL